MTTQLLRRFGNAVFQHVLKVSNFKSNKMALVILRLHILVALKEMIINIKKRQLTCLQEWGIANENFHIAINEIDWKFPLFVYLENPNGPSNSKTRRIVNYILYDKGHYF